MQNTTCYALLRNKQTQSNQLKERMKMTKIKVNFNGKEIERKLITDGKGDKYIQHHNEKWLLHPRTNEIMRPVTSNLTTALWERQNWIDTRMYNLDKLDRMTRANLPTVFETMEKWYEKEKEFLDQYYDADSYELNSWIRYAKETLQNNI
jgi:hypothetical protein